MCVTSKFFVLCQFSTGRFWAERDDASTDWQSTVADIASGEVNDVIEVRRAEDWADVTGEVARAVMSEWANDEEPLSYERYSWIELVCGTRAARSFLRAG